MKLSYPLLKSAGTPSGDGFAPNSYQLKLLGVAWPPTSGWIQRLIGQEVPDETWDLIMKLRGVRKKGQRQEILKEAGIILFQKPRKQKPNQPMLF